MHHGARGRKKKTNLRSKWWERVVGHVGKAWGTDMRLARTRCGARDWGRGHAVGHVMGVHQ